MLTTSAAISWSDKRDFSIYITQYTQFTVGEKVTMCVLQMRKSSQLINREIFTL